MTDNQIYVPDTKIILPGEESFNGIIDRKEFEQLFPGNEELFELLVTKPTSVPEMVKYYLPSKLWRLNNLYTIIDRKGNRIPFNMNIAQFKVYAALLQHFRLIILKSRQQGISTFFLINFFDDALFRSYLNIGLMAQGRDEASTLLERVKFCWDHVDPDIKDFLKVKPTRDNAQAFSFTNNSNIFIRTSFRSATLQRLHISEYGKIANESPKKAKETKTGTLQTIGAGNAAIIESTAEGHNDFKGMWSQAETIKQALKGYSSKDFMPVFLSWAEDPACREEKDQIPDEDAIAYFEHAKQQGYELGRTQKNYWISQFRELGGDIYQEYPLTPEEAFRAARDGTYWSKRYVHYVIRRKHRVSDLFDKNLVVYASVDSGMHDYFVFNFWQTYGDEIRIIGEFWNQGEALDYYANYLLHELPPQWKMGMIYLPHDFDVRDMSGEGKTRQEIWRDYGIDNTRVLEKAGLEQGIENVRMEIPNIYIDENCDYLESCFLNYSKQWDEKLQKWTAKPAPTVYNHGADAIRYMVQAVQEYHRTELSDSSGDVSGGIAL